MHEGHCLWSWLYLFLAGGKEHTSVPQYANAHPRHLGANWVRNNNVTNIIRINMGINFTQHSLDKHSWYQPGLHVAVC